jgi:glutamate synthase domain-containing protein 3
MEKEKIKEINAAPEGVPLNYKELNEQIHHAINKGTKHLMLNKVCGQRFIGASLQGDLKIEINGVPGNDLGIFMDGPEIIVNGNCEDQAANTMNDGTLIVNGDGGDVLGLSARGGKIYVRNDVGYRVGIHIKEYEHQHPIIIIGGTAKDFLGEYMAGGVIIVLGLEIMPDGTINECAQPICGSELGTGMHRGKILLRTDKELTNRLGVGAKVFDIDERDLKEINSYLSEFCERFNVPEEIIEEKPFKVIKPISKRPYGGNYCGQLV